MLVSSVVFFVVSVENVSFTPLSVVISFVPWVDLASVLKTGCCVVVFLMLFLVVSVSFMVVSVSFIVVSLFSVVFVVVDS